MEQNWDDLRYFLAVCRTSSFAAAASRLHVTHSTVSRRITALEESLNTQLFLRTEKGCRLTPAGEAMLPYAEQLETTMVSIEESVHGKDSQLSGTVRICAPDGFGNLFLAGHLGVFQKKHPQLEVELIPVPMYYSLTKREVDILITITKPTSVNVVARKLTNYRLGLFTSQEYLENHPPIKNRSDLYGLDLIDYIEDLLYDESLKFMDEFVPGQPARFRCSTIVGQMYAAASNAGISVLPYFMAHAVPHLIPVLPEQYAERAFWLQVNPDSRQLARVRATIDFIAGKIDKYKERFLSIPNRQ